MDEPLTLCVLVVEASSVRLCVCSVCSVCGVCGVCSVCGVCGVVWGRRGRRGRVITSGQGRGQKRVSESTRPSSFPPSGRRRSVVRAEREAPDQGDARVSGVLDWNKSTTREQPQPQEQVKNEEQNRQEQSRCRRRQTQTAR